MITYQQRCALCGQLQVTEDREVLLEDERFEWDEAMVDDFIAGNRHLCFDADPHAARQWSRLADEGEMVPELRWILEAALERKQAAKPPAWAVFTGSAASITAVGRAVIARLCPSSGAVRPVPGRVCDHVTDAHVGRSPPRARAYRPYVPSPLSHRSPRRSYL